MSEHGSGGGWYRDPTGAAALRWWDGERWTDHTRPPGQGAEESAPNVEAAGVSDETAERRRITDELWQLQSQLDALRARVVETEEAAILQEIGIYEYRHPLDNAVAYKDQIATVKQRMKDAVRDGQAIQYRPGWQVNGSAAEGHMMTSDFSKLMLSAYNAEADALVRGLKPFALARSLERLDKVATRIAKLGRVMEMAVTGYYHSLRRYELELTADYTNKVAEEKEREREERARLREEEKVQREIERERAKVTKELEHRQRVLETLRQSGSDDDEIARAEAELAEVEQSMEGLIERAANTRAGYVYVISNVGAFGPGVVKIGMTRRLEPMDRIRELGDASVPFRFDVHALIFSNDAVGLETFLHQSLAHERLNQVNLRREFFYASPARVRDLLEHHETNLLEFVEEPEALEWHQSENVRARSAPVPGEVVPPPPPAQ